MGENSKIEWTENTWNPWMGCHKVSEGCRNCFAHTDMRRYGWDPEVVVRSKTRFYNPLKWEKKAALTGKRTFVFACSWSDWFIEEADPIRDEAWEIVKATPHLTYQILTKRPENITFRLPKDWGEGYPNVWLGVSVETNSQWIRIIHLLKIPCKCRFVSLEPLLDLVNMTLLRNKQGRLPIHWVIAGGETGPHARPLRPIFVRSIRDQCIKANIPFFFKSWGEWKCAEPDIEEYRIGKDRVDCYEKVGREKSGRLLDGQEWSQFPV